MRYFSLNQGLSSPRLIAGGHHGLPVTIGGRMIDGSTCDSQSRKDIETIGDQMGGFLHETMYDCDWQNISTLHI